MTHPQGFRGFVFSLPSSFHLQFISNHCLQNVPRTPSFGNSLEFKREYNKQAKSQCRPSSLEISSLENVKPGINPLFLSQKIAQKFPEKKIPSTQANATILPAKESEELIHRRAQSAFCITQGIVSMARKSESFWNGSFM